MTDDFIYNQVLKGALSKGASQSESRNWAMIAQERYKKGQFKKASKLIEESISTAVKITKQSRGKKK